MMHIAADMSRCPKSSDSTVVMFYWPRYMGLLLHLARYDTPRITAMDSAGPAAPHYWKMKLGPTVVTHISELLRLESMVSRLRAG